MLNWDPKAEEFPREKTEDSIPEDARSNVKKPLLQVGGGEAWEPPVGSGVTMGPLPTQEGNMNTRPSQHLPTLGSARV